MPRGPAEGDSSVSDLSQLSARVNEAFVSAFGRTPLAERVQDILAQSMTLGRFRDMAHLRDEAGDLLCSALQLCAECGWSPDDLVSATLAKIEARRDIYSRLGRKLKVALLGGAFDPIHNGHLEVASEALRAGGVDEVWLMPCFEHLAGKSMVPAEHRLEMCRLALRGARGIGVFDYEIRHRFRGETYHLVKKLLSEELAHVRCDFSLIVGQDNADGFSTWTNAEGLERLIPFIVVPREGCSPPRPSAWYLKPPHRFLDDAPHEHPTSSTEVRRLLAAGDREVERLVPSEVLNYIRTNALYQPAGAREAVAARVRRLAVFASTFDPPSLFHRHVVKSLRQEGFDEVIVCPSGPRAGRDEPEHADPSQRAALADLGFRGLDGVRVDLGDLDEGRFTRPADLETRYARDGEVWHIVGAEMIAGGQSGRSTIQTRWDNGAELWNRGRFVVLHALADSPAPADLPPQHRLLRIEEHVSSAELRGRVYAGSAVDRYLTPEVAGFIARHRLFIPGAPDRTTRLTLDRPRIQMEYSPQNERARMLAARYQHLVGDPPDLILVLGGDGSMLASIRKNWRLRVPFLGLNCGHFGFLMNHTLPADLTGLELVTYPMPMLRVEADAPDGRAVPGLLAYSDAWLERATGQAAWLRLEVDGQERIPKLVGDGVLVATASGSSAYARAMGASPVPLGSRVLTLAGSNVFRPRFWKPMALSDDVVVRLTDLGEVGKRPVRGFVDGHPLGEVRSMTVRRSFSAGVELAFTREFDPSGKLLRSLFPPADDLLS